MVVYTFFLKIHLKCFSGWPQTSRFTPSSPSQVARTADICHHVQSTHFYQAPLHLQTPSLKPQDPKGRVVQFPHTAWLVLDLTL